MLAFGFVRCFFFLFSSLSEESLRNSPEDFYGTIANVASGLSFYECYVIDCEFLMNFLMSCITRRTLAVTFLMLVWRKHNAPCHVFSY